MSARQGGVMVTGADGRIRLTLSARNWQQVAAVLPDGPLRTRLLLVACSRRDAEHEVYLRPHEVQTIITALAESADRRLRALQEEGLGDPARE